MIRGSQQASFTWSRVYTSEYQSYHSTSFYLSYDMYSEYHCTVYCILYLPYLDCREIFYSHIIPVGFTNNHRMTARLPLRAREAAATTTAAAGEQRVSELAGQTVAPHGVIIVSETTSSSSSSQSASYFPTPDTHSPACFPAPTAGKEEQPGVKQHKQRHHWTIDVRRLHTYLHVRSMTAPNTRHHRKVRRRFGKRQSRHARCPARRHDANNLYNSGMWGNSGAKDSSTQSLCIERALHSALRARSEKQGRTHCLFVSVGWTLEVASVCG